MTQEERRSRIVKIREEVDSLKEEYRKLCVADVSEKLMDKVGVADGDDVLYTHTKGRSKNPVTDKCRVEIMCTSDNLYSPARVYLRPYKKDGGLSLNHILVFEQDYEEIKKV